MGKSHSVNPPLSAGVVVVGEGVNLHSNLQKGRGLTGPQHLEGAAWKEGLNFFREVGGNFHMKNKIKSEIFDNIFLCHNLELKLKLGNFN